MGGRKPETDDAPKRYCLTDFAVCFSARHAGCLYFVACAYSNPCAVDGGPILVRRIVGEKVVKYRERKFVHIVVCEWVYASFHVIMITCSFYTFKTITSECARVAIMNVLLIWQECESIRHLSKNTWNQLSVQLESCMYHHLNFPWIINLNS